MVVGTTLQAELVLSKQQAAGAARYASSARDARRCARMRATSGESHLITVRWRRTSHDLLARGDEARGCSVHETINKLAACQNHPCFSGGFIRPDILVVWLARGRGLPDVVVLTATLAASWALLPCLMPGGGTH